MRRDVQAFVFLAALLFASSVTSAPSSGGGNMPMPGPEPTVQSPEEQAAALYKAGLKQKRRAWKQEEKAAKARNDKSRAKAEARAEKAYEKAAAYFAATLKLNPQHHEAANEMGYALRKLGDFERAIKAYTFALQLKPDFFEAVEYRGEAYLALGRYDEVKAAYMTLFRNDAELADLLMDKMSGWLDTQASGETAAEFAAWVRERQQLAEVSQHLSSNNARSW